MNLLKIDAEYIIASLRLRTQAIIDTINEELKEIDDGRVEAEKAQVNHATYVRNLETLVQELTDENAKLASAAIAKPQTNPAPKTKAVTMRKKRGRTAKAEAPWGYKKDGTPKQRPGRKVA